VGKAGYDSTAGAVEGRSPGEGSEENHLKLMSLEQRIEGMERQAKEMERQAKEKERQAKENERRAEENEKMQQAMRAAEARLHKKQIEEARKIAEDRVREELEASAKNEAKVHAIHETRDQVKAANELVRKRAEEKVLREQMEQAMREEMEQAKERMRAAMEAREEVERVRREADDQLVREMEREQIRREAREEARRKVAVEENDEEARLAVLEAERGSAGGAIDKAEQLVRQLNLMRSSNATAQKKQRQQWQQEDYALASSLHQRGGVTGRACLRLTPLLKCSGACGVGGRGSDTVLPAERGSWQKAGW
jgi:hypothetical protein